jgi:hypothetical protein
MKIKPSEGIWEDLGGSRLVHKTGFKIFFGGVGV